MECKAKCLTSFIFKALCSSGHKQHQCTLLWWVSYFFFQDVRHLLSEEVQKAWKIWAIESNSLICDSCGRLIAEQNIRTSKQKSETGTKTTTHGHCDSCEKDTCHVYRNIIEA